jgi:glyoxylase-like metal-dependent hydrolase (beta-lactamase superfamily II)
MFTEICPGVFSFNHSVAEGKNAIVFGKRAALAIDCGLHPHEGDAMAKFIADRGFAPSRLVLTHCHNDHILGGRAFKTAEIFAHRCAPLVIARHLDGFARICGVTPAEIAETVLRPTVLVDGETSIDLGDRVVRLIHTPGHSEDHISAYLEAEQLLIAGDVVVNAIIPAFGDGDSRVLEASLQRLLDLRLLRLLPGHGTLIEGRERIGETLRWTMSYLRNVRHSVRETLARGLDKKAAAARAGYRELVGDRLPLTTMQQRHANSVGKIFDEESPLADATAKPLTRPSA